MMKARLRTTLLWHPRREHRSCRLMMPVQASTMAPSQLSHMHRSGYKTRLAQPTDYKRRAACECFVHWRRTTCRMAMQHVGERCYLSHAFAWGLCSLAYEMYGCHTLADICHDICSSWRSSATTMLAQTGMASMQVSMLAGSGLQRTGSASPAKQWVP